MFFLSFTSFFNVHLLMGHKAGSIWNYRIVNMIFKLSYLRLKSYTHSFIIENLLLWFTLTHLCFSPQILLSVDLERQPLGHLQFLNVPSRRRSESRQSSGDRGCGGGCSWGTGGWPGCWQILHPLLRVEHALNLLLNLRRTHGLDVRALDHIYEYAKY